MLLVFFAIVCFSLFLDQLLKLFRSKAFWLSFALYFLFCTMADYVAIRLGWWVFADDKILGIHFITIPLEEYILFALIYFLTIGFWEAQCHELG